MVKTAPPTPFEVSQSEFLFQFLIITFDDDPSVFGKVDKSGERYIFRQRGKPVFEGWLSLFGQGGRPDRWGEDRQ